MNLQRACKVLWCRWSEHDFGIPDLSGFGNLTGLSPDLAQAPGEPGKLVDDVGIVACLQCLVNRGKHTAAVVGAVAFPDLAHNRFGVGDFLLQESGEDE